MLIDPYRHGQDPGFGNVVLLLKASAGALVEYTGVPSSVVVTGAGAPSTAQVKWGTHSFRNPGTSAENGHFVRATAAAGVYQFPGAWTWEGWFYLLARQPTFMNFFANIVQFPSAGHIQLATSNTNYFFNSSIGDAVQTVAAPVPLNTWVHLAVTRDASNVVRLFLHGVLEGSATRAGTAGHSTTFDVGRGSAGDNADFDGYFDDIRITKGTCRYTASFTPPSAPFPTS